MKDRTPVLYALKKVAYDKAEFHVAIEKTEQFYNLSKDDKKALFIDVHGVLKHQYILKLEIDTIFPEYAMNDDSSMLLSIALFEMRRAKSEEERTNILNEIVETFKERGISLNDETIKKLIDESKNRFVIPDKYKQERTDEKGQVVEVTYSTKDYVDGTDKVEEKKTNVYLPYNYDESKQYNIIYLIHGTDRQSVNHIETWLYTVGIKNVLDNMIFYNDIDPVIVVTPSFYSYGLYGDDNMTNIREVTPVKEKSTKNFGYELRYDLIPAVESKYSTYAEDVDEKSLIDSRDHRAMAGLSNGARITLDGGMTQNFDYISWFGCFSSSIESSKIIEAIHSEKNKNYKLNYLFNADGIYDFAYNAHKKMYEELLKDESFNENNLEYVEIAFGYHSPRSWQISMYDALQRFFKEA